MAGFFQPLTFKRYNKDENVQLTLEDGKSWNIFLDLSDLVLFLAKNRLEVVDIGDFDLDDGLVAVRPVPSVDFQGVFSPVFVVKKLGHFDEPGLWLHLELVVNVATSYLVRRH